MDLPKPKIDRSLAMELWITERSDYAKEQIILNNLGLIGNVLKSLNLSTDDEDLFATGIVGVVKAINTFMPERGIKFSSYAVPVIKNEVLMTFRKKRITPAFSINDVFVLDGEEVPYSEAITDNVYFEEKSISDMQIKESIGCLSERERNIILLRTRGNTQEEIAKKCKISQSYVSRIIKSIRKKIENKI